MSYKLLHINDTNIYIIWLLYDNIVYGAIKRKVTYNYIGDPFFDIILYKVANIESSQKYKVFADATGFYRKMENFTIEDAKKIIDEI